MEHLSLFTLLLAMMAVVMIFLFKQDLLDSNISAWRTKRKQKTLQKRFVRLERLPTSLLLGKIREKHLLFRLKTQNKALRITAIRILGERGDPRAYKPLTELLYDGFSEIRQEAVIALGKLGDPRAVEQIKNFLNDASTEIRASAKNTLIQLGVPPENIHPCGKVFPMVPEKSNNMNIDEWLARLRAADWETRWKAVNILGRSGDTRVIDPLLDMVKDDDWAVRISAIEALGQFHEARIADALMEIITDSNIEVGLAAIEALERFGTPVIDRLVQLLGNTDAAIRQRTVNILGSLRDKRIVEPLVRVLSDRDSRVRKEAAKALKKSDTLMLEHFAEAVESNEWERQRRAVEALGTIEDTRTVVVLIQALEDDDADVRLQAAKALDKLGWEPQDQSEHIRYCIARENWDTLTSFRAQVFPALMKVRSEDDRRIRQRIEEHLENACTYVETIIWKEGGVEDLDPQTILINPEVSDLEYPMPALKHLNVYAGSYNLRLVENFMTYAVNALGQKHFKNSVDAHIYGNPEQLHRSLRNTFENVCKEVFVHEN